MSETVLQYILDAVHLVANEGWKLLPLYSFDPGSGLWRHGDARARAPLSLHDALAPAGPATTASESVLPGYLERAREVIRAVEAQPPTVSPMPALTPDFERIRWFPLPGEALAAMRTPNLSCLTPPYLSSHHLRLTGQPNPEPSLGRRDLRRLWTTAGSGMPCVRRGRGRSPSSSRPCSCAHVTSLYRFTRASRRGRGGVQTS